MAECGGNRLLTHQLIKPLRTVFVMQRLIGLTHALPARS